MSKKTSTKKPATKAPAKKAAAPKATKAKSAPAAKKPVGECIKGGSHKWTEDKDGEYCIECLEPKPKAKKGKGQVVAPTADAVEIIQAKGKKTAKVDQTGYAPQSQLTAEEADKLAKTRKAKATKPAAEKKAKAKGDAKDKKLSAIDAAVQVLTASKEPLSTKQMIEAMAAKGLWTSPGGKTPHATLYSAILREINEKGKDARFTKTERGRFTAKA